MKQEKLENILIVYMKKIHGNGNFIDQKIKEELIKFQNSLNREIHRIGICVQYSTLNYKPRCTLLLCLAYTFLKSLTIRKTLFEVTRLLWGLFHENTIKKKTLPLFILNLKC